VTDAKLLLGVDTSRHSTDEAWQFQLGLREAGWVLCGRGLDVDETDVAKLVERFDPRAVVLQDRKEWEGRGWRNPLDRLTNWDCLRRRGDILRLSVLKEPAGSEQCEDMGARAGIDGWICYYHQDAVTRFAPWARRDRMIRTHHSIDASAVPPFSAEGRAGCLLSGYVGRSVVRTYPLRTILFERWQELPESTKLDHPGYGEIGCRSGEFLKTLSQHKVAICTASIHDLLLRKIVEASACGCLVVTNLSTADIPLEITENMVRVHPSAWFDDVQVACKRALSAWNPEVQERISRGVKFWYDWRAVGKRLDRDIEDFGRRLGKW
jgi:hypothetical protein